MTVTHAESESGVTQSCLTLSNPVDLTVHGILQARILEWVAFPFSRGSSQPRNRTQVSHIAGGSFPAELPRKPKSTGVGSLSVLQRIFPTQELNQGLLHCRWILYQLSYQGSHGELGVKVTATKRPHRPQLGGQAGWAGAGLLLRQSGDGCQKPVHPPGSSPQGCSPSVRVPPSPGCPDGCWAPGPGGPFVSALCALPCRRGLTRQEQLPLWVRWRLLVLCGWGRLSFRELRAWDGGRR